jgi:anhydro-N-acetylmuramic acid kinase
MSARLKTSSRPIDNPFVVAKKKVINIIGLNSGTSADGLDIALICFKGDKNPEIIRRKTYEYPSELKKAIIAAGEPENINGIEWLKLDSDLGRIMGEYAKTFLVSLRRARLDADLIGSHGQTIRHLPKDFEHPLTLQVGDPSLIAAISGLPVIGDFRRSDLAAGGQGAPLSPVLHQLLFSHPKRWRAIVNIGGISNATILPPKNSSYRLVAGDCGPGNMLSDLAMMKLFNLPYDSEGETALKGHPPMSVIGRILQNRYFELAPPKSTGRELFGRQFLDEVISKMPGAMPEDIVATVSEITVAGIAEFIKRFGKRTEEIYLCGGGAKNQYFMQRLSQAFPGIKISTTDSLGYDADHLESLLWAFLALKFIRQEAIDARFFTGADKPYIPGKLCLP